MSRERATALFGVWARVNELATTTEDTAAIRNLIAEAGIEPEIHVGVEPDLFTPVMVAEWVLGQWADMIDAGFWGLNTGRNISLDQFEQHAHLLLDPTAADEPIGPS